MILKELSNQITRLMAVLTRAEQGNCPASGPNSPRHRGYGKGQTDRNTSTYPSSHNSQTGLGQTTSTHSSSASSRVGTVPQGKWNTQRLNDGQGSVQNMEDPNSLQCFRCQGWGHMAGECTTPAKMLNRDGGTEGMWPTPHQQQSTINSHHSLPDPEPKLTQMKAAKKKRMTEVTPLLFLNPNLIAHLVGCSNEAIVIVDGQETTTLIDSGAQVSSVSAKLCEDLML